MLFRSDKVPYDLWIEQGWITVIPGAVVDYRFVHKYIREEVERRGLIPKEACFDPWSAQAIANDMTDDGFECIEIIQGMKTLSEPTKSFRESVYQGDLLHDGNPVLGWAISNAVTRQDDKENIQLDKSKSTERIDPIASVINAHVRAIVQEPKEEESVYERRGLIDL